MNKALKAEVAQFLRDMAKVTALKNSSETGYRDAAHEVKIARFEHTQKLHDLALKAALAHAANARISAINTATFELEQ